MESKGTNQICTFVITYMNECNNKLLHGRALIIIAPFILQKKTDNHMLGRSICISQKQSTTIPVYILQILYFAYQASARCKSYILPDLQCIFVTGVETGNYLFRAWLKILVRTA